MRFVPQKLATMAAKQALVAKKNSPSLLFGAGVAGSVVSTVLACRATLKLEEALVETKEKLETAHRVVGNELKGGGIYTEQDMKKDIAIIYTRGAVEVVKLYAPSLLVGVASIAALTKSHHILKERNLALASAYTAVDEAFKAYRARVVEKYGEEEDRTLRHDTEAVTTTEKGREVTTYQPTVGGGSMYAKFFDETSSSWMRENEYNYMFLTQQQSWFNDILQVRGYVFLNEVYKALGIMETTAGQSVGWFMGGEGDSFVDFGLRRPDKAVADFVNGRENAILLDFNVDGPIYHLLDQMNEKKRGQ
jgi:Family of unknown function (DUF6353)